MTQLLTADYKPFCLGDVLWQAPYPHINNSGRKAEKLATTPETMEVRNGLLFTTQDVYPGDECLGEVRLLFSSEEAANEAYIQRINEAIAGLQKERERVKERRMDRKFRLYVEDFDVSERRSIKRFLASVKTQGQGVKPPDVVAHLVKSQPILENVYNAENQTISGLKVIVEEVDGE